ncbi:MAG: glycosyltransferase family 2 protein [Bacteroidota bacterium]
MRITEYFLIRVGYIYVVLYSLNDITFIIMGLLEIIIGTYCAYFVAYNLIFALVSFLYKKSKLNELPDAFHNIAVLVPAYKCDAVILSTVRKNLETVYPKEHWKLFVIADGLTSTTRELLKEMPIELVEVNFEKSTKVKSLQRCMDHPTMEEYDTVVILDADNVMEADFLMHMNQKLEKENAIQGLREASNQNNSLAVLDGISESLNITTFRQGPEVLGLSVSLCGSGMAFKKKPFLEVLKKMNSIGGFDRELEFELLSDGVRSSFLKEAIVYDEKTDELSNFKKQRTRWISSHFHYLKKYFKKGMIQFLKGNFTYFHSTILRNLQLPRAINIGLLTLFTLLAVGLSFLGFWNWKVWVILWSVNTLITFLVIPRSFFNRKLINALFRLPKVIFSMFLLLFRLKGANRKFIHTTHKVRT